VNAADLVLLDSMALAYEAFQGCRHHLPGTPALLELLELVLVQVEMSGALRVEVPSSWLTALTPGMRAEIRARRWIGRGRLANPQLLPAIAAGAAELSRLWSAGAEPALRSLGYALHNLPLLASSGERFEPKEFLFCFRIAASRWADLSPEMRLSLCELAGITPETAERKVAEVGFVIDAYGARRRG
jgi:hypothetical protein